VTAARRRAAAFAHELDARDDLHATADYRRDAGAQARRATIEEAQRCRA
jgi:2-furoyl-CoA dehydrogenase FAD binding subunit